jgi:SAM-dependent methyltransferase
MPPRDSTVAFFDEMAPTYERDLEVVGWDPLALLQRWPVVPSTEAVMLDVGCGTGAALAHLSGGARTLYGFDASPGMIRHARRHDVLKEADLRVQAADDPWPLPDGHCDWILALAMLEFVPDLDRFFDEVVRVLAPWGRALVTVEDVVNWEGQPMPSRDVRYGRFPLWRRTWDEIDLCLPPGLVCVRRERIAGYRVDEDPAFICAYHVLELAHGGQESPT